MANDGSLVTGSRSDKSRFRKRILTLGLILAATAAAVCWPRDPALPKSVTARDLASTREAFRLKYAREPNRDDLLSYLAESYLSRRRPQEAIECFGEIPTTHPQYGRMARYQQGRTLLSLHRAIEAEQQFREVITAEEISATLPGTYLIDARQRLRHILEVELRFEERQVLLKGVVDRAEADYFEVIVYCFPSHLRWNGDDAVKWLEEFHAQDPQDRWLNVALGRYRAGQGKLEEARSILQEIVRRDPSDRWATACLIACLQDADDIDAATPLLDNLPAQLPSDPWLLLLKRGAYALEKGDIDAASRAYQQLLSEDTTNTEAWLKMATIHQKRGESAQRTRALKIAAGLSRIQNYIGKGLKEPQDPNSFLNVAGTCAEIDFDREGMILARYAQKIAPDNPRVLETIQLFDARKVGPPQTSAEIP